MSILSSLVHHEIHDLPNDVHNVPKGAENEIDTPGEALKEDMHLTQQAKKQIKNLKEKAVRPAMYYSEDVRRPCKNGAWQDAHAVESEVELREETPRG